MLQVSAGGASRAEREPRAPEGLADRTLADGLDVLPRELRKLAQRRWWRVARNAQALLKRRATGL